MKTRVDAHLYGFMRCLSTARRNEGQWEEYLLKTTFNKSKKVVMDVCGIGTARTFKRHLDSLIECGLVEEGTIKVKNEKGKEYEYACYFFPFDYDGNYKLMDKELLKYLVNTSNGISIKVYLYLLNCSTAKKDWEFTIKEIVAALGYDEDYQDM